MRERNLICNQVVVAVDFSVYSTLEQKCSASLFFFLHTQCQCVTLAFGEELAGQSPDMLSHLALAWLWDLWPEVKP